MFFLLILEPVHIFVIVYMPTRKFYFIISYEYFISLLEKLWYTYLSEAVVCSVDKRDGIYVASSH